MSRGMHESRYAQSPEMHVEAGLYNENYECWPKHVQEQMRMDAIRIRCNQARIAAAKKAGRR